MFGKHIIPFNFVKITLFKFFLMCKIIYLPPLKILFKLVFKTIYQLNCLKLQSYPSLYVIFSHLYHSISIKFRMIQYFYNDFFPTLLANIKQNNVQFESCYFCKQVTYNKIILNVSIKLI